MRKIVYSIFLILLSGQIFGQALDQFNGSLLIFGYNLSPTTSDSSDFRVLGQFGDARGQYTGAELLVGDLVFIARGVQCAPYEVTVIHFSGPLFDVELKDLTDWGQPDGAEGIVTHLTPNKGYPMIPPEGSAPNGNANPLRACVMDHLINLLDLEEGDTDTDTIYAAYSKLPGEAVDSIVRIVRNDTFQIYTSDPVIQIKGQNGLNSSTDTVKLGGVLIEQTYVSSYNPDDARGYTMQFDYTGDGTRDNFIRLDSLGTIRFRATDTTSNNPAIAEQLFQRAGRKLLLRQISDDRGRLFDNLIVMEDRDLQIENQDSTGLRSAGLYLRDGITARLKIQPNDTAFFEVLLSSDGGIHKGIYLKDSAAINSEVVPGAVWQAVNNTGGGKWSAVTLPDTVPGLSGFWVIAYDSTGTAPYYVNLDSLFNEAQEAADGNGIYSGDGSLVENTLVSGSAYNFVLSSSGDIIFGDFLGGGQLMTLRQDIGGIEFTSVDSFFTVNGIEFPNASPTTKGFAPGTYIWTVDESGQNWNYVNQDSLYGDGGGGGGADGDGIYSGSGSLPGNVLVTGGANNLTINSSGNVTLGEYPTDNYIRTVGGLNQVAIVGTGGTTINGIAHHVQDAQTAGKPAGTYLTTHNATGGGVAWLNVDSLLNFNGLFTAENQLGLLQVDTALFAENIVFRRIDTLGFDFSTNNVIEVDNLGKFLGPSTYESGFRARSRATDGSYSKLEMYSTNRNIGDPEGLIQYNSSDAGAVFKIHSLIGPIDIASNPSHNINIVHPSNARISFSDSSFVANAGPSTTTGILGIDADGNIEEYRAQGNNGKILLSNGSTWIVSDPNVIPQTDSLFFGVDGSYTLIDQNNGVSDSINFESFLSEIAGPDGNGLFSANNQGETALVDSFNVPDSLIINFSNDNADNFLRIRGFGTTSYPFVQTIKRGIEIFGYVPGGGASILQMYSNPGSSAFGDNRSHIRHLGNPFNGEEGAFTVSSAGQLNLSSGVGNVSISGSGFQVIGMVDNNVTLLHPTGTGRIQFGPNVHIDDATDSTAYSLLALNNGGQIEEYVAEAHDGKILSSIGGYWKPTELGSIIGGSIDSLFYQLNTEAPIFVNQTDGANDTIVIETDATALQYAASYVTGGQNGPIDAETGPELLNATVNGTVDSIIASTDYTILSDGRIVYTGSTTVADVEVDISGLAFGSGISFVRFYLAKNGTYIPESRHTSRISVLSAEGHISYILSLAQNDTISVVGVPDVNTMTFIIQDQRLKILKLR